ncbi:uncharacterized protein LOC116073603 [Mastomys coucha]|uniref:uncharacterized protein LOC116073603 n=1 Tax=Mastomys coucha TaxID=35658 RepID=UPI0012624ABE|nr:uncharacterized protein LOC116073603 [Mastomys coucha]
MDSGPPRAQGGSSAPELQGRRDRCPSCVPRSGINAGRTYPQSQQHDPNPRPFTTPLRLQTVTVATNLSAASRALAGPGRGARSLAPPPPGLALRTWPRPLDRRGPLLVHVGDTPLFCPAPGDAAGPEDRLGRNCRSRLRIGPRHGSRPGCSSRDFCQLWCEMLQGGTVAVSRVGAGALVDCEVLGRLPGTWGVRAKE